MLGAVRPDRYVIDLDISLKKSHFRGRQKLEALIKGRTRTIVLHAAEIHVHRARIGNLAASVTSDEKAQTITLTFPSDIPPGPVAIELEFDAPLGQSLRGLYAAKVGKNTYAFTQMEPTDARRMFPCIDEPAAKARFLLTVSIDRDWQVISNGAPQSVKKHGGKKTFRFAETPRISPYLVALAVAPFASKSLRTASDVPIAVHALPDKVGLLDYALETATALLEKLEQYFGIPYPYGKLDLVAVPEFEAGAMENVGAIFFRESLLLADPERASADTRRTIAIILAHEMAHQWFGNLVTMAWWDDLWLNEAFATWMEFKVVSAWKPKWNLWMDFEQMKNSPMALDALPTARSIRAPANTPAEINEMFDPITYSKGAAVLRMLELYLGEDTFRNGVRHYLKTHFEGNAIASDLWQALDEASGKPVSEIAPGWIDQAGFPLLRVSLREPTPGRTMVRVDQMRHFARQDKDKGTADGTIWRVPLCIKFDTGRGPQVQCELLDGQRAEWELKTGGASPRYIFPNAGQGGYFRASLEPKWLETLGRALGTDLTPEERIGLLDDQWALVESGHLAMPDFLRILSGYRDEKTRPVLESVVEKLVVIRKRYVSKNARPHFERFVEATLGRAFADLSWDGPSGEDEERRLTRATVVGALGGVARAPDVLAEAERRAASFRSDAASVDPTLATTVVHLAAIRGDEQLYDDYFARMKAATVPEERERYLHALARFEQPRLIDRTLDASLGPDVRKQDSGRVVGGVLGAPEGQKPAWRFVQKHFDEIKERASQFGIERVVRALQWVCDAETRAEVATFFDKHPVEETKRALAETLQAIDLCIEVRAREEKRLASYLASWQPSN